MKSALALILALSWTNICESTETRGKILVYDTQVSSTLLKDSGICKDAPRRSFAEVPNHMHGTNISGLILGRINKSKYCVYPIALDFTDKNTYDTSLGSYKIPKNVVGVNMSISSAPERLNNEKAMIFKLVKLGAMIHISAGNEATKYDKKTCKIYPLCYVFELKSDRFKVIHAYDLKRSNTVYDIPTWTAPGSLQGSPVMSGTSQSAAIFTGDWFK